MKKSNLPPGVSGNEPEISGQYPVHEVIDIIHAHLRGADKDIDDAISFAQDQGVEGELRRCLEVTAVALHNALEAAKPLEDPDEE